MKDGDTCVVVWENCDAHGGTYPDLETALDYIANWLSEVDVDVKDMTDAEKGALGVVEVVKESISISETGVQGTPSVIRVPEKKLRESLIVSPETPNGWTVTWDVGDRMPQSYQVLKSMYRSERIAP